MPICDLIWKKPNLVKYFEKWNFAVVKPSDNDVFLLGQSDKNVLVFNLMLLNSKGKPHFGLNETDALAFIVAFLEAVSCYHSPKIHQSMSFSVQIIFQK